MPSAGVKTRKTAGEGTGKATAGNGLKTLEALRRCAEGSKVEIVFLCIEGVGAKAKNSENESGCE